MFFHPMKILLLAAVLPGLYLGYRVNRMDKIEKEPFGLLVRLFFSGAVCIIPAIILETVGISFLKILGQDSLLYVLLLNFVVIACSEEGCKYFFLKRGTWNNREFNYRFDGIVYAVAVGLGFAVFENIQYVMSYGLITAIMRAITAVPAHTVFAIFMGHYYGAAKLQERMGNFDTSKALMKKCFLVPVLLHGFYDLAASSNNGIMTLVFWVFLIALDIIAIKRIKEDSAEDIAL